jgi:two-component system, NarL family, response regulator LiaR
MKRTVLIYGLSLAGLILALKFLEYRYLIRELSIEFYLGAVALGFTALGVWAGLRLTSTKTKIIRQKYFEFNEAEFNRLGLSKRELEVLKLMAQGLSNQEIADTLFVSHNTIKTHISNLFLKLDVKRRTQAIQKGKELMLIA